jgi:hypothetical protein
MTITAHHLWLFGWFILCFLPILWNLLGRFFFIWQFVLIPGTPHEVSLSAQTHLTSSTCGLSTNHSEGVYWRFVQREACEKAGKAYFIEGHFDP